MVYIYSDCLSFVDLTYLFFVQTCASVKYATEYNKIPLEK